MRKNAKALIVSTILFSISILMTGCGKPDVKPDKDVENEVTEEALPEDFATPTPIPDPIGEPPEAFAPRQEILDADFSAGIIQVGDDIFQVGGYITVKDFLKQYSGKYISATESIHNTSAMMPGGGRESEVFVSNDSWLRFKVEYENLEAYYPCTVGEAVVTNINFIESNEFTKQNAWFPGGFRVDGYGENAGSLEEYFENSDIEYVETEVRDGMIIYPPVDEHCREDTFTYTKVGNRGFEVWARAKESNLHHFSYYFHYIFSCNEDTGKLEDIRLNLERYSKY